MITPSLQARTNQETLRTRRRRLVLPFLAGWLVLLFMSQGAAQDASWRLEEVLSIGGPQSDLLSMWVGVAVDAEGNIYVSDNLQCRLMKFDSQGKLLKKTGRRGQKPGEFMTPRAVSLQGNEIYVIDPSLPAIQAFDLGLNFKRRIPLPYAVQGLQALPDGTLAALGSGFLPSDAGKILILDQTGRRLKSIAYRPPEKESILDTAAFVFSPSGDLYAAMSWLDLVLKVNAQGKTEWTKSLLNIKQVKMKKVLFLKVPESLAFKDIALDPEGRLFILGGQYGPNPSRDVYVLSQNDGRLLATLTLPQSSHCLYLDSRGFLYSRADKGLTLKKYKIIVPAKNQ